MDASQTTRTKTKIMTTKKKTTAIMTTTRNKPTAITKTNTKTTTASTTTTMAAVTTTITITTTTTASRTTAPTLLKPIVHPSKQTGILYTTSRCLQMGSEPRQQNQKCQHRYRLPTNML